MSMAHEARERDRLAAVSARRTALVVLPVLALGWVLVVALVDAEIVTRVATLTAIVPSVMLGAAAAVTTRRFQRTWMDERALRGPPMWVTLVVVAGAVAAFVAWANVAADISAGRAADRALVLSTLFTAVTAGAAYAHVAGGRAVSAALREPSG